MIPASSWALVAATVVCFFETLDFHTIWRVLATSQVAGRAFSVIESSLNSRRNSCEGWRMGKIILKQFNIHRPAPLLYGQRTRACNWSQRAFWLHRVQEGLGAVLLPSVLWRRSCVGRRLWRRQKRKLQLVESRPGTLWRDQVSSQLIVRLFLSLFIWFQI